MKITNESKYAQSLDRCKAIGEQITNLRTELRELEIDIFKYQGTDRYHSDRSGNVCCERRNLEFGNLKSEKGE